jgi:hypothetical protein
LTDLFRRHLSLTPPDRQREPEVAT